MSQYWFEEAKVNDLLRIHGPLGTFFLRDVAGLDLFCLATGTGMAPIKAMLEGLAAGPAAQLPRSISVYWGGRLPQDLYWNPVEVGLELDYFPVLSRAAASWPGLRGHIQQAVLASNASLKNAAVYACGSLAMIDSARTLLVAAGLGVRRFFADAFVSSSQTLKVNP
jgi:CDP-4-dehydro-6-deoxyglucose reductase